MADPIVDFFEELGRRGNEPMLARVTAAVCFDIVSDGQTDSWRVDIQKGDLAVSHSEGESYRDGEVDCFITAQRRLFEGIASGTANAMAALLRGELAVSGDPELVVVVLRLFPAPPRMTRVEMSAIGGNQK